MTIPDKKTFDHVLVPTDFGDCARHAVDVALELGRQYDAGITLVHAYEVPFASYPGVVPPTDMMAAVGKAAGEQLERQLTEVRARYPRANSLLCVGVPWKEIVRAIETTHASLVVMGTHGRSGLDRFLMGSVAERVVRASPVPVLTVR